MKKILKSALSTALLSSSLMYFQASAAEPTVTAPDVVSNFSLSAQNSFQNVANLTLVPIAKSTEKTPLAPPSQHVLKKITEGESLENTTPAPYGLTLSKKELEDYEEKQRVKADAPALDQIINENSAQYFGILRSSQYY